MSGHSKWANIRVKKTAQDARRGKIFTRHARLIEIAARAGGGDPRSNTSLRVAIENAKAESVPNDNIERAIKKGCGALKGEAMQEALYAAYLPGGVACLIKCLTDNRNRTTANLKLIIGKHGGNFAETNSVLWMFERVGPSYIAKQTMAVDDEATAEKLRQCVEAIEEDDDVSEVYTSLDTLASPPRATRDDSITSP